MNEPLLGGAQHITPVISIGPRRFQVEWDFGGLRTITLKQAKFLLGDEGDGMVVARLRDVPALSLRQKLLSNVGRVGEMASPPKSFMFDADVLVPKNDGTLEKLALPGGHSLSGNCLVHRQSKHADLVFDQSHEHDFTDALHAIDQAQIAAHSRQFIGKCAEQSLIRQLFRTGLQRCAFPLSEIAPANLYALQQPADPNEKRKLEKIGSIVTASVVTGAFGKKQNSAGLIFHIRPVTDS